MMTTAGNLKAGIVAIATLATTFTLGPVSSGRGRLLCPVSIQPGALAAWGSATDRLMPLMPIPGEFVSLSEGGSRQTLAIKSDGTLYVNPDPDGIPDPGDLGGLEFCSAGNGRNHGIALLPDGSIRAWPPPEATAGMPTGAGFTAVTGAASFFSLAIDRHGRLVTWGDHPLPAMNPPKGNDFRAISARGRYAMALAADGRVYAWGSDAMPPGVVAVVFSSWRSDGDGHFVAPFDAANPYTAIAAGLDVAAALRQDGTVVVWDSNPNTPMPAPPNGVVFTRIAAGNGFVSGIADDGRLYAWGRDTLPLAWVKNVPEGRYSAVSAAASHVAAIRIPEWTPPVVSIISVTPATLSPPNHAMVTAAVTFRADDPGSGVSLSGLSVKLRSNEPDNGFGSGDTVNDTNGQDGYNAAVTVPTGSIIRNTDGSYTATFQLRAEQSNELPGPRVYTISIVATDNAVPGNVSAPVTETITVGRS